MTESRSHAGVAMACIEGLRIMGSTAIGFGVVTPFRSRGGYEKLVNGSFDGCCADCGTRGHD